MTRQVAIFQNVVTYWPDVTEKCDGVPLGSEACIFKSDVKEKGLKDELGTADTEIEQV